MADDELRMRASVDDRATPALGRIQRSLMQIQVTPGMQALRAEMTALGNATKSFSGAGFGAVMGSFGVGSLTAAGAVGALLQNVMSL